MKVLLTDVEQPNTDLEQSLLSEAGFKMIEAQCRTPQDVIHVGQEATALVVQLVPIQETHHLVTEQLLSQISPGSYLVNASRGALVDLDTLLQTFDNGQLAGAALDVLPQEPPPPDHPILNHPRVLLSPHAAFYSVESDEELRRKAILNIITWAQEGRPPYVVVEGRSDS